MLYFGFMFQSYNSMREMHQSKMMIFQIKALSLHIANSK